MSLPIIILALVTLQRLGELWLSNRNTRRLLARGAHEVSAAHYPLIVAVHALWLAALWWFAPGRPVDGFWLALFILLQLTRVWVLATLGPRWTTRIVILPGAPLVTGGPYRFVNHPNYVVVAGKSRRCRSLSDSGPSRRFSPCSTPRFWASAFARKSARSPACAPDCSRLYRGSLLDIVRCLRLGPFGSGPEEVLSFTKG